MNWTHLGAKLAQMGLPLLGRIVGGQLLGNIPILGPMLGDRGSAIGEGIGRQVAAAIALAVGLPPDATPEAISTAIDSKPTTEVVANLQAVQAEVAARYPAIVEMFKADAAVETRAGEVNANAFLRNREIETAEAVATNNFWMTLYRPAAAYAATGAFVWLLGLILYGFTFGGAVLDNIVRAENMVMAVFGALIGVLLGHWFTRASERRKALDVLKPPDENGTAVTVVKK